MNSTKPHRQAKSPSVSVLIGSAVALTMASAMLLLVNMNDKDAKELPNPPDAKEFLNPPDAKELPNSSDSKAILNPPDAKELQNSSDATELPNPPDATELPNPPDTFAPRPVTAETDDYASFDPPANWNPLVENHLGTDVPADKLDEFLKVAYIANRGYEYSEERPIEVSSGKVVVVRFPADTNATPGFRRRGPYWAATVTIDAETMRVLSVVEDAN